MSFAELYLQADDSNQLLIQPVTLRRIGQLVAQIVQSQGRRGKAAAYRLVLGVENSTTGECAVVGVEIPWSSGFQAPSHLGKLFQMACTKDTTGKLEVRYESFDGEYLRFTGMSFSTFVIHVNKANEELHRHARYLVKHEVSDEADADV
jgi:hypothetical protein